MTFYEGEADMFGGLHPAMFMGGAGGLPPGGIAILSQYEYDRLRSQKDEETQRLIKERDNSRKALGESEARCWLVMGLLLEATPAAFVKAMRVKPSQRAEARLVVPGDAGFVTLQYLNDYSGLLVYGLSEHNTVVCSTSVLFEPADDVTDRLRVAIGSSILAVEEDAKKRLDAKHPKLDPHVSAKPRKKRK